MMMEQEPLDDDLVLDITLPAPDLLWRACSAEEFDKAKLEIPREASVQTPRALLQQADGSLETVWSENVAIDSSVEMSRLVMECFKLDRR